MPGLQDIYNMMQTLTQSLNNFASMMTVYGGGTWAINNISSSPTQILPANSNRSQITFHNPNPVNPNIWVYPSLFSSSLGAAPPALGGCYLIIPGAYVPLSAGNKAQTAILGSAWLAFCSTGFSNIGFTAADQ